LEEKMKPEGGGSTDAAAAAAPVVRQVPPSPKVYIRKIKGKGKVQK
jgi:hypothetical protein